MLECLLDCKAFIVCKILSHAIYDYISENGDLIFDNRIIVHIYIKEKKIESFRYVRRLVFYLTLDSSKRKVKKRK